MKLSCCNFIIQKSI